MRFTWLVYILYSSDVCFRRRNGKDPEVARIKLVKTQVALATVLFQS